MNSLESQLDFLGSLQQHKIELKTCSDEKFIQQYDRKYWSQKVYAPKTYG